MSKLESLPIGLTFDDVLILPAKGGVKRSEVSLSTMLAKDKPLGIPIISAAMDTVTQALMAEALGTIGGLGVIHRNNTQEEQAAEVKKAKGAGVLVGAALGPQDMERARMLVESGCDVLFVDTASAHNSRVIEGAKAIKMAFPEISLVVGNVATKEAAQELLPFVDAIKVGVGPGSICTTRVVTGVGVPQLSAVADVADVARQAGIPVIADGGIRQPGDIAKALGAGAHSVMLGSMLAGSDEAPGDIVEHEGRRYKAYRGMGSMAVMEGRKSSDRYFQKDAERLTPEGIEASVPAKGSVDEIVAQLLGALRSSFGYVGAATMDEFHERVRFVRITEAGRAESAPHSVLPPLS